MSVLQIKNELLKLLTETNDATLLEKVRLYFQELKEDSPSTEEDSFGNVAPKVTVKELNERIERAEKQEGTSYEDFKKRYRI